MGGDVTLDPSFFRTLVEAAAHGVVYVSPDGYVLYANPRAAMLAGAPTAASLVGMHLERFFRPEERLRVETATRVLQADGVYRLTEYDLQRLDGSRFSAEIGASVIRGSDGQLLGYTAVVRDVSAQKLLRESFTLLFERNPLPMWVYDIRTLRFLAVNRAATEAYGYSTEEFLSLTIADIRPPEDIVRLHQDLVEKRSLLQRSSEWRHRTKNGSIRQVEIFSHTLPFHNRDAVLVVVHDVTEQRYLEEQLRQSQKMEAVGRLAGGIAHDFNNLLTAIIGYSNLLLTHPLLPAALRSDIQEIADAGESAAALTQQLLAFSRKQIVQPRIIDANALLDRIRVLLQRTLGEDIALEFKQTTPLMPVHIDPGQFEQVVMNLAVNARDAMPQGGRLTIETATVDLDVAYARQHLAVRPGRYLMLAVSDTGTGILPEVQAHIFEPFFTTKPQGQGTGLGLSTVFGIVKQNDGNIYVYSEPGHGTTFKVYLPAVDDAHPEEPIEQRTDTPLGSETILLVEDDARLGALAKRALESFGYTVLVAAEGNHAIDLARTHPGPLHALVTDVVLPNISGRALASTIEQIRPGTKVLFVSGYTADAVVHRGVVDAGIHFLQKPFTPDILAKKVRAILDEPHPGD